MMEKCNVRQVQEKYRLYLILMIRRLKKYKCGSNASCIAKKGKIETKMRKTHKTMVKQRKNKIKTRQNAHFSVKNR